MNKLVAFVVKHKFGTAISVLVILMGAYYVVVYSMTHRSDFASFRLSLILKEQIPELKNEVSFGSTLEGCNFYSLRKCLALQVGNEIHQKPEILTKLTEFVSNPCRALALKELEEISQGKTEAEVIKEINERIRQPRNKEVAELGAQMHRYWVARKYFDCDYQPEYDRPTKKIVLNVYKNLNAPSNVINVSGGGTFYFHDDLILSYQIVKHIN